MCWPWPCPHPQLRPLTCSGAILPAPAALLVQIYHPPRFPSKHSFLYSRCSEHSLIKLWDKGVPGGLVVRIRCVHRGGPGSLPRAVWRGMDKEASTDRENCETRCFQASEICYCILSVWDAGPDRHRMPLVNCIWS